MERVFLCEFYECKGKCSKGKEAELGGICEHCQLYKKSNRRFKINNKAKKLNKIRNKEFRQGCF